MGKNRHIVFLCWLATQVLTPSAIAQNFYFVSFTDKGPCDKLHISETSKKKKAQRNIPFHNTDYAVHKSYINSLANYPIKIVLISRWLNGCVVESRQDCLQVDGKYISSIQKIVGKNTKSGVASVSDTCLPITYGSSVTQLRALNLDSMHLSGYKGEGVHIAIFDGGFTHANKLSSLQKVFSEKRILHTKNLVQPGSSVFTAATHGTNVFSILASFQPGGMIGSAPCANYSLFVTEDVTRESVIEEYYWLKAAELADSLGVDVINSSLGYTVFDKGDNNHLLTDLDGKTTVISRAANIAATKGIVVVNSAGNTSPSDTWKKIVVPADADSILAVGAVDEKGKKAHFSAVGPTADGRIKPDVVAPGTQVFFSTPSGTAQGNGTSYAAPLVTGLVAGLLQSAQTSVINIVKAVKASGNKAQSPDTLVGYGLPNFMSAYAILQGRRPKICPQYIPKLEKNSVNYNLSPNPVTENLYVKIDSLYSKESDYSIADLNGRILYSGKFIFADGWKEVPNISSLPKGVYVLKLAEHIRKIVKL